MSELIKWIHLAPCKYCGGSNIHFVQTEETQKIQCMECGIQVSRDRYGDADDWPGSVLDIWNWPDDCVDETAPDALPLVCDFISQGDLQVGDVLYDENGEEKTVTKIEKNNPFELYPIRADRFFYTSDGWRSHLESFNKKSPHIVKIVRDGEVVAEGQRYDA